MTDQGFAAALTSAAAGDPAGFDLLFRRTQPVVLRYLRTLAGDDAEDLASETWVAVIRGLRSFRGGETEFRAWVLTVARHRMVDAARARARRPVTLVASVDEADGRGSPDAAEDALESMATAEAVALIASLPPDQAEAVLLRVVAGLDTARTAALMDRSAGAVRVLTHRGLRTLLARLEAARATGV